MVLRLRARRFTCEDVSCGRRTFVEQVAGLTRWHSQRTERMQSVLAEVGLALAGRAGARLADVFGANVSRNTVLRLVDALPELPPQVPRVVGVDEYAMRRGRSACGQLILYRMTCGNAWLRCSRLVRRVVRFLFEELQTPSGVGVRSGDVGPAVGYPAPPAEGARVPVAVVHEYAVPFATAWNIKGNVGPAGGLVAISPLSRTKLWCPGPST